VIPEKRLHEVPRPADAVRIRVHRKAVANGSSKPAAAPAAAPTTPFTECPAVGLDTSCEILVQVTDSSNNILGDPSQGPFDGSDDTLIGVLNSSSDTITSIQLSSDTDLFGFDGDGLCTSSPQPAGCPFGPTGYEGPDTSFAGITSDESGGVVNFTSGLAPGQTAYFSLEEPLTATTVTVGGPSAGEQGGPVNLSENRTTCSTAMPVNCATGVFWHQFTDSAIPGRGMPLDFSRTYSSSLASTDGPLGFGWTDSYDMSLATDASGDVTISQEDGSTVTFQPNGAGGFTAPPRVLATLTQNPDSSYTFIRDSHQTQYNFSASGQLTSEVDRNGYVTQLTYNSSGLLAAVTDPAGRTLTFAYAGSHIATMTDPMGRTWSYSYDSGGNLTSAADPAGRTWSYAYDSSHQMLTMTDPRGGVTTNTYNGSGQVTSQADPAGHTTTWSYSGDPTTTAGGTTTMTDPNGNVTTYTYSDLELQSVTHAAGTPDAATTSYTYDAATLGVSSITDPNGNVATNTYDASGNLLSATGPLGNTANYSYNSFNEVLSKSSPLGETTNYGYDGNGNLLTMTDPLGNTTTYADGDSAHPGDVTSVTDPNGNVTSYAYDSDGDMASDSVSPSSGVTNTASFAYDADGERTCEASPNATNANVSCPPSGSPPVADTTATSYNADGEITSVTDPGGHATSYTHDGDGNLTQVTDPAGHVTSYTYDGDNEQTKITRPDGSSVSRGYDPDRNLTSKTDAAGNTTKYAYNTLNRVISTTDPLGRTTSYGYDADGNRTTLTDPSGRVTTDSYDQASRLTGITYSDGTTPDISYTYDADGRRSGITDGTGTTSYAYDAYGRLTSVTNGAGATVSYSYDPAGQLTSLTYPNGQAVTRSYNGAGQLSSVSDWLGNVTKFSYDANGNLTNEAYPNGVSAVSSFDNAGQLMSITDKTASATLASFAYTRDSLGQVTSTAQGGTLQGTQSYSYTQLSQVASDNSGPYSYDPGGNPTQQPGGITRAYDAADQLTSATQPVVSKAPVADQIASANETSKGSTIISSAVTTKTASELVLAFISANGPAKQAQTVTGVSGGSLKWSLAVRSNGQQGTAEVWQAQASKLLKAVKITATLADKGYNGAITIATYTGAGSATGANAAANGATGAPGVSLTTTGADSLVWAAGEDPSHATARKAATGQSIAHQYLDSKGKTTSWAQDTAAVPSANTVIKIADTAPTADRWEMAAVEITAATAGSSKITYGYDKQGNRTSVTPAGQPATALTYDQANRLISYGTSASYAYNGDGLRMSKKVGSTTTGFAWDQSGALPLLLNAGSTNYIYGPGGQPIEQIAGTTATYLQADQQGSTRLLTNSAGTVIGTYTYGSYGTTTSHTGTAVTGLQFDGQYTDAETGFQYLLARYYDPATAQFLTEDPVAGLTGAIYTYTNDDPLNGRDPSGLFNIGICGGAGGQLTPGVGVSGGGEVCVMIVGWGVAITVSGSGGATVGGQAGGSLFAGVSGGSAGNASDLAGPSCSVGGGGHVVVGLQGSVSNDCSHGASSGELDITGGLDVGASGGVSRGQACVLWSTSGYRGCGSSSPGIPYAGSDTGIQNGVLQYPDGLGSYLNSLASVTSPTPCAVSVEA
jgi:RHS repeat-associated protein